MKVLGLSGLHHSESYMQQQSSENTPNCNQFVQGLDSACALIIDGKIVAAAAEERFSGQKHTGSFPIEAIQYCLKSANLSFSDLDVVAHGFNYEPYQELFAYDKARFAWYENVASRQVQQQLLTEFCGWSETSPVKFIQVPHHLAHAASSYYLSGFDEALVLVADGMGETQSLSLFTTNDKQLNLIAEISDVHSLGIFYRLVTHYLGFQQHGDEGKVMGLAAYGDETIYYDAMNQFIVLNNRGTFTIPSLALDHKYCLAELIKRFGPTRQINEPITQHHQHIACALQAILQQTLLHVLSYYQHQTQQTKLCMAGGVALNCMANAAILQSGLFESVYIQPAAGDDGTALGAALHVAAAQRATQFANQPMPYFGPAFDQTIIDQALSIYPEFTTQSIENEQTLCDDIAAKITDEKIVGWFQGRAEFGPRALGNRSILADPRVPHMQQWLNTKIKQREDFRPFAPAVLFEDACDIFEINPQHLSTYKTMQCVAKVKAEYCELLPAITHVDGTARVQVVAQEDNPKFWQLLTAFKKASSLPVLLNTSLNINKQPMACTPADALQTFEHAKLDYLVLENMIVSRRG